MQHAYTQMPKLSIRNNCSNKTNRQIGVFHTHFTFVFDGALQRESCTSKLLHMIGFDMSLALVELCLSNKLTRCCSMGSTPNKTATMSHTYTLAHMHDKACVLHICAHKLLGAPRHVAGPPSLAPTHQTQMHIILYL